ncbi:phytoene/squalene synthase family protein [Pilimelia columellifera]|uniref:Phytoene/squalene synthase family protein n=1 Tax=Pilimelia columellifera subsp. columellifera TaxID=706583 RepID=A0ABN3MYA1_9ACTN
MHRDLADSYSRCRELHRRHGRTYYLATRLLPRARRPHVHALYGFARYADEIVDAADVGSPQERAAYLDDWSERFLAGLDGAPVADPLLPAVINTIRECQLDRADFASFLRSMTMDLTVTGYETYDDLLDYMEGSAAVIGTMMLPVLGARDRAAAREPARQLGLAFQLTNFIRDIGEDLDRGRIYLPREDLRRFGVTAASMAADAAAGTASAPTRQLVAYAIERARAHYVAAAPGVAMLDWVSRPCVRVAYLVYGGILDEIARADHDVFSRRAVVSRRRRLALAVRGAVRSDLGARSKPLGGGAGLRGVHGGIGVADQGVGV